MKIIKTINLSKDQKNTLLNLWNKEYPYKLNHSSFGDFEKYLQALSDKKHLLLLSDKNQIQGWAFTFIREKEKWFAIILDTKIQGNGYGKLLLNKLKESENKLNGWVIDNNLEVKSNGGLYNSPTEFYIKNDFQIDSSVRLETDKISVAKIKWRK